MPRTIRDSIRINDWRRRMARGLMRLMFGAPAQLSNEPLPKTGIYRIVICHISHTLGNALLLTPLIQELEATWPGAEIDIVTRSQVGQELYGRYSSVNRVFQLPSHGVGHPRLWLRGIRGMRKTHYDLAIDPDPQSQTGRLLLLMAKATYKLGFTGRKKSGNVTHAAAIPENVPSKAQRPVFLLRSALGNPVASNSYPVPDIRLDAAESAQGRQTLARVLAASPAASPRLKTIGVFANATGPKLLGQDWWTPLLNVLEASCPDYQLVEIVPMFGRSMMGSRYPAYYSSDLRRLGGVLAALDAYISLDCGIMHLACASQAPTLGIFTTTNAAEWGPYGPGNHAVHAYDMPSDAVGQKIAALIESDAEHATPVG